jgi:hypothetical protein
VAGSSISGDTFDLISRVIVMVGRMDAVGGPLLDFGGDNPFVSSKLSFRTFPQAVFRTSRNAVSVLLFTETTAISELVLGKLRSSFSIAQEADCTDDLDFPRLASGVNSAPVLLRALRPISLSHCVWYGWLLSGVWSPLS